MELDALKNHINQKLSAGSREHSPADIAAFLGRKTVSVMQKLRRSLYLELALTLLFSVGCVMGVATAEGWAYEKYFWGGLAAGLVVSAMVFRLILKTRLDNAALPVKANLESIAGLVDQYLRLYLWLGTGLIPLMVGLAFWLAYQSPGAESKAVRWDLFAWLILGALALSYASFRFTRWYLKRLYGSYLEELQGLIREFREEDEQAGRGKSER